MGKSKDISLLVGAAAATALAVIVLSKANGQPPTPVPTPTPEPTPTPVPGSEVTIYNTNGTYYGQDSNGAVITSGTDIAVVINTMFSAIGYGIIKIRQGNYNISSAAYIPDNSSLIGDGMGITVIKATDQSNILPLRNIGSKTGVPTTNITMKDFTIDLNGVNQSGNSRLAFSGTSNSLMERVEVMNARDFAVLWQALGNAETGIHSRNNRVVNCKFHGQQIKWDLVVLNFQDSVIEGNEFYDTVLGSNYALSAGRTLKNVIIQNNTFHDLGAVGIGLEDVVDITIRDNLVYNTGSHGIFLRLIQHPNMANITITGNHCHHCGNYPNAPIAVDGINGTNLVNSLIRANISHHNNREGIMCQGLQNSTIDTNQLYDNNQGHNVDPRGSGIVAPGGSPMNNLITNNNIYDDQPTPTMNRAIYFANGDFNTAHSNRVDRMISPIPIFLAGANSDAYNNIGVSEPGAAEPIAATAAQLLDIGVRAGLTSQNTFAGSGNDSVGTAHLIPSGTVNYTTLGYFGQAAVLEGAGYFQAENAGVHDQTTNSFTITEKVYRTVSSGLTEYVVSKRATVGAGYALFIRPDGHLVAQTNDELSSTPIYCTSAAAVPLNKWTTVGAVWNRQTGLCTVYINGKPSGTPANISGMVGSLGNTQVFTVGRRSSANDGFLNALIDDLRTYDNLALTDGDMLAVHEEVLHGLVYECVEGGAGFIQGELYVVNAENTGMTPYTG